MRATRKKSWWIRVSNVRLVDCSWIWLREFLVGSKKYLYFITNMFRCIPRQSMTTKSELIFLQRLTWFEVHEQVRWWEQAWQSWHRYGHFDLAAQQSTLGHWTMYSTASWKINYDNVIWWIWFSKYTRKRHANFLQCFSTARHFRSTLYHAWLSPKDKDLDFL